MKDKQNIAIALLCVSGTVLAALVGLTYDAAPARADVSASAGEYIMFTGQVSNNVDLLYVIDLSKRRMNAYEYSLKDNNIVLKDQVDLGQAFRAPGK